MPNLDERILSSLSEEDEEFLKGLDTERGVFEQMAEAFRGPLKYHAIAVFIFIFIASGIGLWTIFKIFAAETTREMLLWMAASWAAWTTQITLKQWMWNRVQTLSILRELKRIELRVVKLEAKGRSD